MILLDKKIGGVSGEYGAVYENFEKDIYQALEQALPQLEKYETIKIIFSGADLHAAGDPERFLQILR